MKTKLATLVLLGASVCCVAVLAQNSPAPDENVRKLYSAPADASAAGASGDAVAPADSGEVLPLVQFEDAPLVDVIKTLARQANLNLIFDPRVVAPTADGKSPYPPVSIRLENVTAQNVLEAVLNNNNLRLERDAKTKISRVSVKDPAAAEPLVPKTWQLKYTSPSNLVLVIKPTLSTPRAQVLADARSSQLIVLATEKDLLAIDELIQKLDTPTKQVLIEAKILETTKNPSTARGINWEGTFANQQVTFGNGIPQGENRRLSETTSTDALGNPILLTTDDGVNQTLPSAGPTMMWDSVHGMNPQTYFLDATGVRATLNWFNKDNDTEVLATPRTVTADNETAKLSVTRALPIFKVSTGGTQSGPTVDITYTNIGISLEVTPRISANNSVALKLVPEVSNVEAKRDVQTVAGLANTANIYAIRKVETRVLIPSGNTLVMGGLIYDTLSKEATKVPILGDLPLLGQLFRSSAKTRDKRNLVIFVTPTIVTDEDYTPSTSAADFLKKKAPEDPSEFYDPEFDDKNILDSAKPYDWSKPVY
jgi:type IV pilus secretin PilQ/predicted competence protein